MASSDSHSLGVTEADADVSLDGMIAYAVGTTEYTEEVGAYLGDLVRLSLFYMSDVVITEDSKA